MAVSLKIEEETCVMHNPLVSGYITVSMLKRKKLGIGCNLPLQSLFKTLI